MAHTYELQEKSARQLPHHATSVSTPLTHEHPFLVSFTSAPLAADFPLQQYHPPPCKHAINATTGLLPLTDHSPLGLLHAGVPHGQLLYRGHDVQAVGRTKKDCGDNERNGLYQIVPLRPMVSRAGGMPICRIMNPTSRQVTFSKRRNGLLKKAYELSVLCDAEVGVIIFSATGRLSEFASCSTSMAKVLEKYQHFSDGLPSQKNLIQEVEFWRRQACLLREQILFQEDLQSYMLGKNLLSLDLNDVEKVEDKLKNAINNVRVQKAQLMQAKAQESIIQEARLKEENDLLKRKLYEVTNLQTLKEQIHMRSAAPAAPYLGGDVMRRSMHQSSHLGGDDKCTGSFISQDMNNPLKLQLGLELFPTSKRSG